MRPDELPREASDEVPRISGNCWASGQLVRGVCIVDFSPESKAEKAGMGKGDVIIEYDGIANLSTRKLAAVMAVEEPGLSVRVRFVRSDEEHSSSLEAGPLGIWGRDTVILTGIQEQEGASDKSPGSRIGAGLVALGFKTGPKIFTALGTLAKSLKLGKVGLAATSLAAYSSIFSWQFALLIMIALFVHECGHIWAMKQSGLKTKGIYFIPLLGAAAVSDGAFPSRGSESFIALMGPIWGLGFAALTGILYWLVQEPILAAAAGWMAALNLFNLLPVSPLDGGRVMKSVAYSMNSAVGICFVVLGLVVSGYLAYELSMGLFVFLLVVGTIDLIIGYKRRVEIPSMNAIEVLYAALAFVSITGMLWALMWYMRHEPGADLAMKFLQGSSQ